MTHLDVCKDCGTTETPKWYKHKTQCQSCYQRQWQLNRGLTCEACGSMKSTAWYSQPARLCGTCWKRLKDYSITLEELKQLKHECNLCGSTKRVVIDHCHETGRVRGELCTPCNIAIGQLGDTPEAIQRVLEYLGPP